MSFNIGSLTEENLLFLEAWKMVDRAYYDKTFNGQSWFRYRENALRNEPMNTREETCKCLDLPKEKLKNHQYELFMLISYDISTDSR